VKIDPSVDEAYTKAAASVSLSKERQLKIVYTPLHGCGTTSVCKVLKSLGFEVLEDSKTMNPSGRFGNITFNIPNPEVAQSFDTALKFAKKIDADIILSSDPDADRIGIMVKHNGDWVFLNGNKIAAILTAYVIHKRKTELSGRTRIIAKTIVTTNLVKKICEKNNIKLIGDLLIGFKYIADVMNTLEKNERIDEFLLGAEESHGYIAGNYARDKDAVTGAVWLSELSAELKKTGETIIDYLDQIYCDHGYFKNYATEIRLLGASGREKIDLIQKSLRNNHPKSFGKFKVKSFENCLERKPIVSETDKSAKDILIFHIEPIEDAESIKVTVRPSGTEPKIKIYFEIGTSRVSKNKLAETKQNVERVSGELEKEVMLICYGIIGIDFPERGFLLFSQLPIEDKLKYFEIEREIENLRNLDDKKERNEKLSLIVSFLGSNPVQKIDEAFCAKHGISISEYLDL